MFGGGKKAYEALLEEFRRRLDKHEMDDQQVHRELREEMRGHREESRKSFEKMDAKLDQLLTTEDQRAGEEKIKSRLREDKKHRQMLGISAWLIWVTLIAAVVSPWAEHIINWVSAHVR